MELVNRNNNKNIPFWAGYFSYALVEVPDL
jgi:hypothetical protein